MLLFRHFLMLFFIFLFSSNLLAKENKTIFSIVSDRSASNLNSGANTYLQNSNDKIIIRTVNQVALMSDEELDKYLTQSDSLLFCAVFGDVVDRLLSKNIHLHNLEFLFKGIEDFLF